MHKHNGIVSFPAPCIIWVKSSMANLDYTFLESQYSTNATAFNQTENAVKDLINPPLNKLVSCRSRCGGQKAEVLKASNLLYNLTMYVYR